MGPDLYLMWSRGWNELTSDLKPEESKLVKLLECRAKMLPSFSWCWSHWEHLPAALGRSELANAPTCRACTYSQRLFSMSLIRYRHTFLPYYLNSHYETCSGLTNHKYLFRGKHDNVIFKVKYSYLKGPSWFMSCSLRFPHYDLFFLLFSLTHIP